LEKHINLHTQLSNKEFLIAVSKTIFIPGMKFIFGSLPSFRLFFFFACTVFSASSCHFKESPEPLPGVSLELAEFRSKMIDDLQYEVFFQIPDSLYMRVKGSVQITFQLTHLTDNLILDFQAPEDHLISVRREGENLAHEFINEHIVIPGEYFQRGRNTLSVEFISTDQALNRKADFMYTLFVPDRASTAFPCFDQPDLKAVFSLSLDAPGDWLTVANERPSSRRLSEGRNLITFEPSKPLPTYLFSFVSGQFDTLTMNRDGRTMTMYHRETDSVKLTRNQEELFRQHAEALGWLEEYTGIDYPFSKFDFIAIPFFQYGGMEHPGAILYRASRLFLEENASQNELLARANLIAHETAHMWFGDLVTMRWFNDVWMKEVFANFIADKIVNPLFPEFNHQHRFLFAHFPRAYEIDRSAGANPIRQELDNMKHAGTLYGNIIYHKAPIMMNQLEKILGEVPLREGLRRYLSVFSYGNADWPDLIRILDPLTKENLREWSRVWVDEPGRPEITIARVNQQIFLRQSDPSGKNRSWSQMIQPGGWSSDDIVTRTVLLDLPEIQLDLQAVEAHAFLPDLSGEAYGQQILDDASLSYLMANLHLLESPLHRGIGLLILYEEMLSGRLRPGMYLNTLLTAFSMETDILNKERILSDAQQVFWSFLGEGERKHVHSVIERSLWEALLKEENPGIKTSLFRTYASTSLSEVALSRMHEIWENMELPGSIKLSETDLINLSCELALKNPDLYPDILELQLNRITNADREENFRFIIPALSPDSELRDDFFESLKDPLNRKIEPRVLQALQWLHHPIRARESEKYIRPSLDMLQEIQITGDIFFPKNWLDATLGGHQRAEARNIVEDFLKEHPDYPASLKGKILQSSDILFRATRHRPD
jgi:aminopeptidase N